MMLPKRRGTDQDELIMQRFVKDECGENPEDEEDPRAFYLKTRDLLLYVD